MLSHKEVEQYILSMPNSWLDYPFGEDVAVYKVGPKEKAKMFALIAEKSNPVNISLKCEPQLSEVLRKKYATVMPGYHLNKKHWNTIVVSDKWDVDELKSLILHSYNLVSQSN
ncbi:MAG: MmcQ/YjbR family DNA-binding protein [Minisyncoccia bacterium]